MAEGNAVEAIKTVRELTAKKYFGTYYNAESHKMFFLPEQ
jgi:hypothetical protein